MLLRASKTNYEKERFNFGIIHSFRPFYGCVRIYNLSWKPYKHDLLFNRHGPDVLRSFIIYNVCERSLKTSTRSATTKSATSKWHFTVGFRRFYIDLRKGGQCFKVTQDIGF